MRKLTYSAILLPVLLLALSAGIARGQEYERYVSLKGEWKFSIGDDKDWSRPEFNDGSWEQIYAPRFWEDEGFHGYDGYAWYRKAFYCPEYVKGKSLYLDMGYIDDADEVYVNGHLIGFSGKFPPGYQTAYNAYRRYPLPERLLNIKGNNIIAVRVYDSQLGGGITGGNLGIYGLKNSMRIDFSLEGEWKFKTGDRPEWKERNFNDGDWNRILVPGFWERQGFTDYDGFAWYRIKFALPDYLKDKKLVLVLGKIDDIDEAYLNGKLIGSTGRIEPSPEINDYNYSQFRGYFIPQGVLQPGKENTIAVRVYDGYIDGGIYQGPVGFVTQEKYTSYWRQMKKKSENFWDRVFGN